MLKTLAISNYRSLGNLIIPLGALNLITGPNGSGKSNIYRALRLLADTARGGIIASLAREGGISSTLWAGPELMNMTLRTRDGRSVPLSQIGTVEIRPEDPILKRRDRVPTITVQCDIDDTSQPPEVTAELAKSFQPIIDKLHAGYAIEVGASVEEAGKANAALAAVFPIMIVCMLVVIILQVRSLSALVMTLLTAPLGVVGVVPILLIFHQPFGFDAILGLIALGGILMRNTLILIGQIKTNREEGLDPFHALVEATVQRSRPVVLTALAAVLAFIPLTFSAFWGSLAYTLIGGTAVGTLLTLIFLPALYSIWFRVKPTKGGQQIPDVHIP